MEKRIGNALITLNPEKTNVQDLNLLFSKFSFLILSRQGVSLKNRQLNIIQILFEGEINQINKMAGKIGQLDGIKIKIVFL
jgi:putative iron-only hydrogenase system regulator